MSQLTAAAGAAYPSGSVSTCLPTRATLSAIPPALGRAGILRSAMTNAAAKADLRVPARLGLTHDRRISPTRAVRKN